ncbi:MAG: dialkylresorcinol condensing enzyme [Deltaproteobacteria bacterium]|nr:dialkylresorcinol condensing enzyme [Deltaproteobacteria bacterium]
MKKRVLVLCYSQTGQLKACAQSLTGPLRESGEVEVDFVELVPEKPYPFPWGMKAFLSVFPQSVLGEPPPIQPPAVDPAKKYDLAILAYQVWYLSPAPPVVAFLRSPQAEALLQGTPLLALCACRNMWQRGWVELKRLVAEVGGRIVDHVVLIDQGPDWSTFYTTPRWLIAGKKEGGPFPPAGVSPQAIAGLRAPGERLLEALRRGPIEGSVFAGSGVEVLEVRRRYLLPEMAAKRVFRLWAKLIHGAGPSLKYPLGLAWFFWLLFSLPLAVPIALSGELLRLLNPSWYRERIEELVQPSGGPVR